MKLNHTLIIPTDDKILAQKMFESLIYDEDFLLVIVLGDDDIAQKAVKYADSRARISIAGYERKVVWIRNREILSKEIKALNDGLASLPKDNLERVVAFSVSFSDTVMDVILSSETIDFLRLDLAFNKAGVKK